MRKILAVAVLSVAGATLSTVGGSVGRAFAGNPTTVVGTAVCNTASGQQTITWTFTNSQNVDATIDSAAITTPGLTAGSSIEASATMSPTVVASLATSTGVTHATGDATGTITLTIHSTSAQLPQGFTTVGTATLVGGCVAATTTTAVAGASGQLPHVGQGQGPLTWIAVGLVGIGLALTSVRRRPRRV